MKKADAENIAAPYALPSATPRWEADRILRAERFDDVYFNRANGLREKRHVFLNGCGLPDGWRQSPLYTVGELGFGTGLTFLATWDLWRQTCRPGARLHYIAVEGYPLTHSELSDSLALWPELRLLADVLLRSYPASQPGFHRLVLHANGDDTPVYLTLLCGDVRAMLSRLEASIDAWFLDGFAPDKNPEMWSPEVFAALARLSHGAHAVRTDNARGAATSPTRVATYTVAGAVRRGLKDAGFEIARAPGFGAKREMLHGTYNGIADYVPVLLPWFARPAAIPRDHGHVAIVGAGIAGCATAAAMRRRGWSVTLIDRNPEIAQGASGNPVGILMPRVTAAPSFESRFSVAAWRFLLQTLEKLSDDGVPLGLERCGVLQLATDDDDGRRLAAIAATAMLPEALMARLSAQEASNFAGSDLGRPALLFPQAGGIDPRALCRALAKDARCIFGTEIAAVRQAPSGLELIDSHGHVLCHADAVVFANGLNAATVPQASWLPLAARRGQLTLAPSTAASTRLRCILSYGGYVTPAFHGRHAIGATFDWVDNPARAQDVVAEDHRRNLAELKDVVPSLMIGSDESAYEGRAALRCTSPDHLPMVGPLPNQAAYLSDYAQLHHGRHWVRYPSATYHPGLYLLTGLGSRGLTEAPLAAELLASHITGEPWPLERELVTALHPARFLVRDLKRLKA